MRRLSSLDAVVPVLRQLILTELLLRDTRPIYRAELARRLGVSPSSLQRPLQELAQSGLVRVTKHGREVLYEVDPDNPLVPELTNLLRKTRGLRDVIRDALNPCSDRIRVGFIYGSLASGSERPTSDVDLLIVGDATLSELTPHLHGAESKLGRPVNAVLYTPAKLLEMWAAKNHFLRSVLDKPKLFVVGTENELESALGGRPRRKARHNGGGTQGSPRSRGTKSRRRAS